MKKLFNNTFSVAVFTITFIVSLFILPEHILTGDYFWLGVLFVTLFALNMTCLIKTMRERAKIAKANGAGIIGIIATAVGFTALQMCGVGGPLCGALFGSLVFASIIPAGSLGYFTSYAVHIVIIAIILQIVSLWFMKCFSCK